MIYHRDYLKSKAYKTGSKYFRQAISIFVTKTVCYSLRNLKVDYHTKKIWEASSNIKNTWKVLKKLTDKTSKVGNIQKLIMNGVEITDPSVITEKLNKYFSTVGPNLSKKMPDTEMLPIQSINRPNAKFKFRNITANQVYDLLGKLKNGKASGIDLIPNKVLKLAAPHISTSLAAIFNKCILHGIFPDDLKTGKVVPIFEGDERHERGNYRSITILSSLARSF